MGRALRDFVSDEHQAVLSARLTAAQLDGKATERLELIARRLDGSALTVDVSVVPTVLDGDPALQVVTRDVSEASVARDALRLADEKWRSLVTSVPDQIVMLGREGAIQFIGRTCSDLAVAQVLGRSVLEFIEPTYQEHVKAAIARVFETGETVHVDAEAVGAGGTTRWLSAHIGPLRQDGDVVATIAINTDVTDRHAAEEELRLSEEKWRALVTNAPDTISMINSDGRFLFINRTSSEMSPEDVEDLTIFDVSSPDKHPEARALLQRIFDKGESGAIEAEMTGTDGGVR